MTAREKAIPTLSQRLSSLRGSSHPILARADDGCIYVVKSANNPHGSNILFNECAGNALYRALGLPTPRWTPVFAPTKFFHLESQSLACSAQSSNELCFASHYLGEQYRIYEILSSSLLAQVQNRESFWTAWIVDVCAKHTDNRQTIFVKMPTGYKAIFVDNGDMFGGPNGTSEPHLAASQYLDDRIYCSLAESRMQNILNKIRRINLEKIWGNVLTLSAAWQSTSGLAQFSQTLDRLGDSAFIRNVMDDIQCIHEGHYALINVKKPPQSIRSTDLAYSTLRREIAQM